MITQSHTQLRRPCYIVLKFPPPLKAPRPAVRPAYWRRNLGCLLGGKAASSVRLTTQVHLVPKLTINGRTPALLHVPSSRAQGTSIHLSYRWIFDAGNHMFKTSLKLRPVPSHICRPCNLAVHTDRTVTTGDWKFRRLTVVDNPAFKRCADNRST